MVIDPGEGNTSELPQFGEIVLPAQTFTGVTNGELGHIVVHAVVGHQCPDGPA